MSDSADDIVKRMQLVRRDVGDDVKGIVETAKTLSDWRYHVKHHPWILLGGAVALGFLVAPKRRKIPGGEAKELAALLKKYNVGVTSAPTAGKGFARSMLSIAAPFVMRSVMSAAQQRFSGGGPLGSVFGSPGEREEPAYEDFNIPR